MGADWFGWREAILLATAGVAVYIAFLVLRLIALGQRRNRGRDETPSREKSFAATCASPAESAAAAPLFVGGEAPKKEEGKPSFATATDEPPKGAAAWSGGFGEQLAAHLAKSEMERELRELRAEVERLRREVESLRERRSVSPQYAEALALIERGLSAQEVADQLGISLAEAELVQALAQRRFDDEERGEGDDSGNEPRP